MCTVIHASASRTYVVRIDTEDGFRFIKFHLPDTYENSCQAATWFFYNELDSFNCGGTAFPFEDYANLEEISQ